MDADSFDASEIVQGLWVGGLSAAEDSQNLLARHIVRVVSVGTRLHPQLAWPVHASESIAFFGIDIQDHPLSDILGILPEALRQIDKVMKDRKRSFDRGVLVHCASGISRSVSVCVAWLMMRNGLSLREALQKTKDVRPQALPNHGFMQSLELLEREHGDLRAAHKLWQKANAKNSDCRDASVAKLRKKSDKFANRAARLEEKLQRCRGSKKSLAAVVNSLKRLAEDIQSATPVAMIDDNLANCVRHITEEKVKHLLCLWEPLIPVEIVPSELPEEIDEEQTNEEALLEDTDEDAKEEEEEEEEGVSSYCHGRYVSL